MPSAVTAEGDVRMIITLQDGAEALLAIATQALSVASTSSSLDSASALLSLAGNACVCVQQLVGQAPVAQKYMREAGQLTTLLRTLRCVFGALALQARGSAWTSGLHAAATVLLDTLAAFVIKAGSEGAGNAKVMVQSAGLLEMAWRSCPVAWGFCGFVPWRCWPLHWPRRRCSQASSRGRPWIFLCLAGNGGGPGFAGAPSRFS